MKKFFIWGWIGLNFLVLLYMWGILVYAGFSGKPLQEIVRVDWWMMFILVDLWTTNSFSNLKSPFKSDDN